MGMGTTSASASASALALALALAWPQTGAGPTTMAETARANMVWQERHRPPVPLLPACAVDPAATAVASLRALPEAVVAAVRRVFGGRGIGEADGAFNATDMIDDPAVPSARFLRAYRVRDLWIVWVETGGIVRGVRVVAIADGSGTGPAHPVSGLAADSGSTGDPCVVSRALLASRPGPDEARQPVRSRNDVPADR